MFDSMVAEVYLSSLNIESLEVLQIQWLQTLVQANHQLRLQQC